MERYESRSKGMGLLGSSVAAVETRTCCLPTTMAGRGSYWRRQAWPGLSSRGRIGSGV